MATATAKKALVSKFVSETGDQRRIARASNIATWFIDNYSEYEGQLVSSRLIRADIIKEADTQVNNKYGDMRAHGDALGNSSLGLGLDYEEIGGDRYIVFSLINLVRCARYLLGKGRKVRALTQLSESEVVTASTIVA